MLDNVDERGSIDSGVSPMREDHFAIVHSTVGGYSIAKIWDYFSGSLEKLSTSDAIVIAACTLSRVEELVSRIRSYFDKNVFIKPIFVKCSETPSLYLKFAIDGVLESELDLEKKLGVIQSILLRQGEINLSRPQRYEELLIFNFMAFVYTRGLKKIEPRLSRDGIVYPVFSDAIARRSHLSQYFRLIEKAEAENYIIGSYFFSTYVCSQCLSDHLLYREVCPKCRKSHLKAEELVHHFRCAHVAPLSDFAAHEDSDAALSCPKCQHDLKHIGVDYDKPSTMFYCQSCQAEFQNFSMMARCVDCHHDQEVELLVKKNYSSYELSEKGMSALLSGYLYPPSENDSAIAGTMPWHLFIKTLNYEAGNKRNGFILALSIVNGNKIEKEIGYQNIGKLFAEIVRMASVVQKSTDFCGFNNHIFYFTFFETSRSEAEIISQRLTFLINSLLHDNLKRKTFVLERQVFNILDNVIEAILGPDQETSDVH